MPDINANCGDLDQLADELAKVRFRVYCLVGYVCKPCNQQEMKNGQ